MSTIFRRFISYIGKVKLSDFKDKGLASNVNQYCESQEEKDARIKQAAIQGTQLHLSHKDPSDPKEVISIQFFDDQGRRVGTGHLHADGTSKFRYKQAPPAESPSGGFTED